MHHVYRKYCLLLFSNTIFQTNKFFVLRYQISQRNVLEVKLNLFEKYKKWRALIHRVIAKQQPRMNR